MLSSHRRVVRACFSKTIFVPSGDQTGATSESRRTAFVVSAVPPVPSVEGVNLHSSEWDFSGANRSPAHHGIREPASIRRPDGLGRQRILGKVGELYEPTAVSLDDVDPRTFGDEREPVAGRRQTGPLSTVRSASLRASPPSGSIRYGRYWR